MTNPIYLDNQATTPLDPAVLESMLPYFNNKFGNAASTHHSFGHEAKEAVEKSRKIIAKELNTSAREIVFTSGATESINLAIKGISEKLKAKGRHIVTQVTEHNAVLDTCSALERRGWEITKLPVQQDGRIDPKLIEDAIRKDTVLVTIMHANTEIGVIQPVREIGDICKHHDVYFLVDACQSFAKISIDVQKINVDLLAFTAHKIYGPKGIGALFIKKKNPPVELELQMDGGGHERGFRSGTLPVALIVGFGKAVELCSRDRDAENKRLKQYRDQLIDDIMTAHTDVILNGSREKRLSNNLNLCFPGIEAETLIMNMKNIACSTGSACTSASLEPSHVITALGYDTELAHTAIRFSLGRFNNADEIAAAGKMIINAATAAKQKKSNYL
ncbi:MAG TPA: aminotransferase class V-fold PLP-dependent enzyme [Candidatus Marinimicrobia bacterium]|nr:aminotransferase class V-fold PLP-dependent enzyme [Candidatus Neomarinimicrobiota bacterium]